MSGLFTWMSIDFEMLCDAMWHFSVIRALKSEGIEDNVGSIVWFISERNHRRCSNRTQI
jgi:hypothetical protein